ncbi:aldolase [Phlyctema vagabunda]|uniref:Aldolase n=1 Tax=Phlyctema vagabunda TaxID=108571 RepID=A0ABR4PNB0_9HELO
MAPTAIIGDLYSEDVAKVSKPTGPTDFTRNEAAMRGMGHQGKLIPSMPKFTSFQEQRQWQLEHMAGAFRVFAREGYAEGISGHISVRDPEYEDQFWINPLGVHFEMLKASDMVLVDLDGNQVGGNRVSKPLDSTEDQLTRLQHAAVNAAGFTIHSAVHRARPDVHAICHTHSIHGRAWSAFARPLEMLNQDVCYFYNAHAVYDDYGGMAFAHEEGERIAKALGHGKGAILKNHGLLTVGETVDEAAFLFMLMERSCKIQLLVESAGLEKKFVSDEEAAYNFKVASTPPHLNVEDFRSGGAFRK